MEVQTGSGRPPHAEMSVIGRGITITGNIEASVDLQLLGAVHGDVKCAILIMAEESYIKGSIHAEQVRISGTIEGSVETQDLAVEAMARIIGDVSYSRIRITNGGVIHGKMNYRPAEGSDLGKLRLVEPDAGKKRKEDAVRIE